jgi:predicted phosphodiesterase
VRVAAVYDVHGNLPALEAVLADVDEERPDVLLVGGDFASGPMPSETLRLLTARDDARFIRGNGERALVDEVLPASRDVWESWPVSRLSRREREFCASLPTTAVLEIYGLGATLFCHGSPRSDEEIVTRISSAERLGEMLAGVEERVVVCGHTHVQFDRIVGDSRIVNAGSVGMPYENEPGAYWALLGPDVSLRRTVYDLEAAAERIRASGFPNADEFVEEFMLNPAGPDEASAHFERMALEQASG